MIEISAFKWVPPFARGLVKDLRVRWALEEAGLPYRSRTIDFVEQGTDAYRALQPFAQVPFYREEDLVLFESGAIVLRIARRSDALMPADEAGRDRATSWMFAALNSLEPAIQGLADIDLFNAEEDWAKARRPQAEAYVRQRLTQLSERLDGDDYLDGRFTAGDLMMTTVLRDLRQTELVSEYANLAAYQARCEARPAFARALDAQMADFTGDPPG
jgi:glutathione S-transferase